MTKHKFKQNTMDSLSGGRGNRSRSRARLEYELLKRGTTTPLFLSDRNATYYSDWIRDRLNDHEPDPRGAEAARLEASYDFRQFQFQDPMKGPPQELELNPHTGRTIDSNDFDRVGIVDARGNIPTAMFYGDQGMLGRQSMFATMQTQTDRPSMSDIRMDFDPSRQNLQRSHHTHEAQGAAMDMLPQMKGQAGMLSEWRRQELDDEEPEARFMMANEVGYQAMSGTVGPMDPGLVAAGQAAGIQNLNNPAFFDALQQQSG